ncbi:LysM peptidoglycan-binding domain-containing protein [Enterovibrio sp. 27052020O]|uniref:LysM peptidoglycan-binding domain-containing protein n=1 Tax=Enterovibrio sp. 27052020O TaxID=3241166 RepID=UPI00388DC2E5
MFKKLITLCLVGMVSAATMAAGIEVSKDAPSSYTVRKGDTLWDISGLYLTNPWQWPKLWQQNPEIKNPHLIYPGDVLRLTWQDGKPRLTYTAGVNRSESAPINSASASILRQYLTYDTLIDEREYNLAPRVLGSQDGWNYISMRTPFFANKELDSDDWFIYRTVTNFEREKGDAVVRMISLKKVGEAKKVRSIDDMSEMKLVRQNQEIKPNDILLPALGVKTGEIFHPQPAPQGLVGTMVGHLYGSNYVGHRQIVVVDLGSFDGVGAGHALSVIVPGAAMKGSTGDMEYDSGINTALASEAKLLPSSSAGKLLVIRSYPFFSLAMVVDADKPLKVDMPVISAEG